MMSVKKFFIIFLLANGIVGLTYVIIFERYFRWGITTQMTENQMTLQQKNIFVPRIVCLILTTPENHEIRAIPIKQTWAKRCDHHFFVSSAINETLPTIAYNGTENRDILWGKTKLGFKHAFYNYYDQADWFFKGDDDTYVIVENLRHMLKDYDPEDPIWFGCKYTPYVNQGYMSGGAGYVLSKEAVRRLVTTGLQNETDPNCRSDDRGAEDVEMGKCLQYLNVTAGDSRDGLGQHRFFGLAPSWIIPRVWRDPQFWYWKNMFYPVGLGSDCCSNSTIAFHYIYPADIQVLDFLIYKLKVLKF